MTETPEQYIENFAERIAARVSGRRYRFTACGSTFPHKEALKSLGFRWNGFAWVTPDGEYKPTSENINAAAKLEGVKIQQETLTDESTGIPRRSRTGE